MARSVWRVLYFIEKHGIVKRQTEANRMSRRHLLFGNVQCCLVRLLRLGNNICRNQGIVGNLLHLNCSLIFTSEPPHNILRGVTNSRISNSILLSLGDLPPGRSKCPTTPLFSMLCLFLEFPVSVLHHPVHELLSRTSSLPFHPSHPNPSKFNYLIQIQLFKVNFIAKLQ